jgi:RNA polymerase sigma-70 factor (ECF subfamily)
MGWKLRQLEEHEDLVQATLLRIFQGLERFEARTEGAFRHWVAHCVECTIRNAARDSKRAKRGGGTVKRWSEIANDSLRDLTLAGDSPTPSAIVQAAEAEERIEASLLELPERYREVIVLRSLCGMSFADVARQIGSEKEATARQIYFRAVQKLKEILGA